MRLRLWVATMYRTLPTRWGDGRMFSGHRGSKPVAAEVWLAGHGLFFFFFFFFLCCWFCNCLRNTKLCPRALILFCHAPRRELSILCLHCNAKNINYVHQSSLRGDGEIRIFLMCLLRESISEFTSQETGMWMWGWGSLCSAAGSTGRAECDRGPAWAVRHISPEWMDVTHQQSCSFQSWLENKT